MHTTKWAITRVIIIIIIIANIIRVFVYSSFRLCISPTKLPTKC